MEIPNCFLYAAPIGEFVNAVEKSRIDDIIGTMIDNAHNARINCTDSEIKSWKANFNVLSSLFCKSKLPNDTYVAFEFKIPVGGSRIDCMLFGEGNNNAQNVVHIELKQWSNNNVHIYYTHDTFEVIEDGSRQGSAYKSHPSQQVAGYHNCMLNYMKCFGEEEDKLKLTGIAYCYNYTRQNENDCLFDTYYDPILRIHPLFCKDNIDELTKTLNLLLDKGKGLEVFTKFCNSEIGTTERLYDVAANIMKNEEAQEIFALVGDQIDTYHTILGAVKNTKGDEKTVIIVKGGPGTGKSVLAIRLLSELYKEEYECHNVYYATRSASLRSGWKNILKNIDRKFRQGDASMLIQSTYDFKPFRYNYIENGGDVLLVDEAHRISNKSNDQTDNHRDKNDRSNLTQIMSLLYTSRVCVFFIDDKQSIVSTEIGQSSEIRSAAENYKKRIEQENDQYLKVDVNKLKTKLEKLEKTLKTAKQQDIETENICKEIEDINAILKRPLVYPKIEKVNILEFELKDQFRCNGSNNYLQWIDSVLYNSESTTECPTLKGEYEFGICETPQELVKEIRKRDEYAVYADKQQEKMGEDFSYKALQKEANNRHFTQSARIVAGWCWDWVNNRLLENGDLLHEVVIPEHNFEMPWETQKAPRGDFRYKYAKDANSWCNQNEGVNQIGCIHSIQGWETDYVGVIIGPDLTFNKEKKCLTYNPNGNNHNLTPKWTEKNDQLIKNTYRVLLTRGKKGCFIYAVDPEVREYFKRCLNNQ